MIYFIVVGFLCFVSGLAAGSHACKRLREEKELAVEQMQDADQRMVEAMKLSHTLAQNLKDEPQRGAIAFLAMTSQQRCIFLERVLMSFIGMEEDERKVFIASLDLGGAARAQQAVAALRMMTAYLKEGYSL